MRNLSFLIMSLFVMISYSGVNGAVYKVAKNMGLHNASFKTIQEAIDACDDKGNTILVMDNNVYEERLEIKERRNITIISQSYLDDPYATHNQDKPTIRHTDTDHVYPLDWEDYTQRGKNNFQSNGVIGIFFSSSISILGFNIDGDDGRRGSEDDFFKPEDVRNSLVAKREEAAGGFAWITGPVWGAHGGEWPIDYGNGGIVINRSRSVEIKGCHIYNNFRGIAIFGRSPDAVYGRAVDGVTPVTNPVSNGNHLIQNNHIYDNSIALSIEFAWELGSTIKHNLVYDNYSRMTLGKITPYQYGVFGFSETVDPQWMILNNTMYHNSFLMGTRYAGSWRAGKNAMLANNIYAERINAGSGNNDGIVTYPNLYNNLFETQASYPTKNNLGGFNFNGKWCSPEDIVSEIPMFFGQGSSPLSNFDMSVVAGGMIEIEMKDGSVGEIEPQNSVFPDAKINTASTYDVSVKENYWLTSLYKDSANATVYDTYRQNFISTDRNSDDFLVPNYAEKSLTKRVRNNSRVQTGIVDKDGTIGDIGALCVLTTGIDAGENSWTGEYAGAKLKINDGSLVLIEDDKATIVFTLDVVDAEATQISNVKYKLVQYYADMPYLKIEGGAENMQGTQAPEPEAITVSDAVEIGGNKLVIDLPKDAGEYSIFHISITGEDRLGNIVYSNTGIFPYRKASDSEAGTSNDIPIEIMDVSIHKDGKEIEDVSAGDTVFLVVDAGSFFTADTLITIKTNKDELLKNEKLEEIEKWDGKFVNKDSIPVVFTRIGSEIITVAAHTKGNDIRVLVGHSNAINVSSTKASKVRFYDPPSATLTTGFTSIPKNSSMDITIEILDYFENRLKMEEDSLHKIDVKVSSKYGTLTSNAIYSTKRGISEVGLTAIGNVGDKFTVSSKLSTSSIWQDSTWFEITDPIDIVFFSPLVLEEYLGTAIPMRVFVSLDGIGVNDNVKLPPLSVVKKSIPVGFTLYYDKELTQPIYLDSSFTLEGSDDTIYVSSTKEHKDVELVFKLARVTDELLLNQPEAISFLLPPIESIFITYSDGISDVASVPRAFSYKALTFELYAWGNGTDGNVYPISVNWQGLGTFENVTGTESQRLNVTIEDAMKGKIGQFVATYPISNIKDTTANIAIIGDIDRIFIIDVDDYDSNLTIPDFENIEVQPTDTISWALGDTVSYYAIGVDDSTKKWYVMGLDWESESLNSYEYLPIDKVNSATYIHTIHIDSLSAVGDVKISLTGLDRKGVKLIKSMNFKVYDPVDNLNIELFSNFAEENRTYFYQSDNNDSVFVEYYMVEENKYMIMSSFWSNGEQNVYCASNWTIESLKLGDKAKYHNTTSYGSRIPIEDIYDTDIIAITITRGANTLKAFVIFSDMIRSGIAPNPVTSEMFLNEETKPKIIITENGDIKDLKVSIFDINGNLTRSLNLPPQINEEENDTSSADSGLKTLNRYVYTTWDGKNQRGEYLSTGSYFLLFNVEVKTSNNEIQKKNYKKEFYYIKK